ncbi:MAG TPA: GNAT family N-acetyltransferase [Stellaceae bacterium]|nr:GNAT family N-acetyltransferase [Stellaceae bacterium]
MSLTIRALTEADLDAADKVRRLAFGTYFGLPDPLSFSGTSRLVAARQRAWPDGAILAEHDGDIAGLAIASRWGSLGIFGPLAVHPQHWRSGVGRQLLDATMPIYDRWQCRAAALFTFPSSLAHVGLYQRYGFWPRSLTALMSRPVAAPSPAPQARSLTAMSPAEQHDAIAQCAVLTDQLYPGLDLRDEIALVIAHPTSDALVLTEGSAITGFAICHNGAGSEADTGVTYAKFAAARPGPNAARDFERLLDAAGDFARRNGATKLNAGVNMGAMEAYRLMTAIGFRSFLQGVAMHRPWIDIYDRRDVFALEDWR